MQASGISEQPEAASISPLAILGTFTRLGLTSFGGPIAHLGYFRDEFVVRRRWLDEAAYAELVAICQFLPGPASSQVGFAIGLARGGFAGALAAWAGFTLPSALIMLAFAAGFDALGGPIGQGILHGLKIVAVAVIAQAVWGMARTLAPDRPRAGIAAAAVIAVAVVGGAVGQLAAIGLGMLGGIAMAGRRAGVDDMADAEPAIAVPVGLRTAAALVVLAAGLLLVLPIARGLGLGGHGLALFDAFYRAGALVFGGGHVVLPLLQQEVVASGWVSPDAFLSGYGAAQAVPGPLFTIAAYLGAAGASWPNGVTGGSIALIAIFLPGLLLVAGTLPLWQSIRHRQWARAGMTGVNAAVVGILGAALYDPVLVTSVRSPPDFALALVGFLLLTVWKAPPWAVVLISAVCGTLLPR